LQGLLAVSDANCALSACASWPFWWAKPVEADAWPDGAAAAEEDAGVAEALAEAAGGATEAEGVADEGDAAEGVFWELPLPAPVPEGRPEEVTKSESCSPSGIGPVGLAGQLPGGFRTCFWPRGIVPGLPAVRPPVNFVGSTPWNWHWKTPVSSAFRGAFWQ